MTTLIIVAHPDDEILGCGGTAAKLSKTEKVHCIIFSFGGKWPPWKKEDTLQRVRIKEAKKAGEIVGFSSTSFLGFPDMEMSDKKEKALELVKKIIKKYKPNKIFTHSINDTHPNHTFVNNVVNEAVSKMKKKPELFFFDISSIKKLFFGRELNILFDITETYKKKKEALKVFKSQKSLLLFLVPFLEWKAKKLGKKQGFKYCEYFYYK